MTVINLETSILFLISKLNDLKKRVKMECNNYFHFFMFLVDFLVK